MKFFKFTALILVVAIIVSIVSYQKIISDILRPQYVDWAHETEKKARNPEFL